MSVTSLPQQYNRRLSAEQILQGMRRCFGNSRRLLTDARLLYSEGRFPSAVALAIISIEEMEKIRILHDLSLCDSDDLAARVWRRFRNHTDKTILWSYVCQVAEKGKIGLDPIKAKDSRYPKLFQTIKENSLYIDCLREGHWTHFPQEIHKRLAKALFNGIEATYPHKCPNLEYLKLWMEVNKNIAQFSDAESDQAIIDWYQKMQECGWMPAGVNRAKEFIDGIRSRSH